MSANIPIPPEEEEPGPPCTMGLLKEFVYHKVLDGVDDKKKRENMEKRPTEGVESVGKRRLPYTICPQLKL